MWKGFLSEYVPPQNIWKIQTKPQDPAVLDVGEGQGLMFLPYPVPMIPNGSRRLPDNCSQWTLLSNACSIGREAKSLGTSSRDATLLQICVCVCVCTHALAHDYYICAVHVETRGHPRVSFHTHHRPLVLLCWFLELGTFIG